MIQVNFLDAKLPEVENHSARAKPAHETDWNMAAQLRWL